MLIKSSRRDAGRVKQVSLPTDLPRAAIVAKTSRAIPMLGIQHVGLPRMLPLVAGGVLAREILLPDLINDTRW